MSPEEEIKQLDRQLFVCLLMIGAIVGIVISLQWIT